MRLFAFNLTQANFDNPTQWPPFPFEVTRLWDTGATWRDIETSPGVYIFTRLDQQITVAMGHGVKEIIYVLGKTPAFYGGGADGSTPMQDIAKAVAFAIALVTHVKKFFPSLILHWEQWNEADLKQFWNGTAAQLLPLTRAIYAVLHPLGIKVLSPSGSGGTAIYGFIISYLTACAKDYPFDVFTFHLYLHTGHRNPSADMDLILNDVKVKKNTFGITAMPTWFTEGSWGKETDYSPVLTDTEKAAYLTILYTKCKAAGVEVFCWYEGDAHGWGVIMGNAAGLAFASLSSSPVIRTTQVSLPVAAVTPPSMTPPLVWPPLVQPPPIQLAAVTPDPITPPPLRLTIQDNTANGVNWALNGTTLTLTDAPRT